MIGHYKDIWWLGITGIFRSWALGIPGIFDDWSLKSVCSRARIISILELEMIWNR